MKKKEKIRRKLLSFLLTLAMAVGLLPGMSLTAQAAEETLLTTITPTGKTTYSETTSGVVTVSHNNDYYDGQYGWLWYDAVDTLTVSGCEGYTITKVIFKQYPDRTVTDSSAPFELHFDSMGQWGGVKCRENRRMDGVTSIEVYGYASKAAQTITAADVTTTYGDTDKSVSASVTTPTTDGGAISYTVKDGSGDYIDVASDGKLTIKKVPASGKAYVIVKAAETDDYAETTKEVTVTISKAEATVAAKDQGIMVGGTVPDLSAPVLNTHYSVTGLVGTDALTTAPTLAYQKNGSAATPDNTTAGTYDIVPSGASAGDNYNISYTNGTLTITAKDAQTITASDVTATYGETDKSVSATTDGNGAISYAVKAGSEDYISVASDGKLTIKKVPADGKAYVTVTASETNTGGTDGNGYAAATKDVTVNISKATVTITAKNQSIYVGGTVPTLSGADFYTASGLVGEDALTTNPTLAYQNNGSAATPDNTTAGTYDIVPSGASAGDNYNISYTNGMLTISEKPTATVTKAPEAKTLTYTGSAQSLVTAGSAEGGEMQYALGTETEATQPYTTSIPSKTDAGTYYVWYKVVGDSNHLDSDTGCVTVTIATADSTDSGSGSTSSGSTDSGSGSTSSGSTDSGSGSSDSGNTSGGTSSGSSDNTNTNTDTSEKVPYDDVPISTGSVNDITGTVSATAESNPFGTKIENNSNLTTLLSLTDAEVAQGVNVWLDIQDMSASVPQTDKTLIQNTSGDYTVGLYLDINLFKKVGSNDATKVTETNGKVKASIVIPESLWKSGRIFEIIRVHDGVATAIAGTYDENTHIFTFETDKFSTYALAYKDPASSSDSGTTSNSSSSNSSNITQSTAPKTREPNDIRLWYLLLIASLGGLGFFGYSKKKKVND